MNVDVRYLNHVSIFKYAYDIHKLAFAYLRFCNGNALPFASGKCNFRGHAENLFVCFWAFLVFFWQLLLSKMNHLITWCMTISHCQSDTLSVGIFLSNMDIGYLKIYPVTYFFGHFWNMSNHDDFRGFWVLLKEVAFQKIKDVLLTEQHYLDIQI